jgi:hypothetical protein
MVKHILKTGEVLEDITGHEVKKEDVPVVYEIRERMNREKEEKHERNL